jgi:hypothetical protein
MYELSAAPPIAQPFVSYPVISAKAGIQLETITLSTFKISKVQGSTIKLIQDRFFSNRRQRRVIAFLPHDLLIRDSLNFAFLRIPSDFFASLDIRARLFYGKVLRPDVPNSKSGHR